MPMLSTYFARGYDAPTIKMKIQALADAGPLYFNESEDMRQEIIFEGIDFKHDLQFSRPILSFGITFKGCTLETPLVFSNMVFFKLINFENCTFKVPQIIFRNCGIAECEFHYSEKEVSLKDKKEISFSFIENGANNAVISKLFLKNCIFRLENEITLYGLEMDNSILDGKTRLKQLRYARLKHATFRSPTELKIKGHNFTAEDLTFEHDSSIHALEHITFKGYLRGLRIDIGGFRELTLDLTDLKLANLQINGGIQTSITSKDATNLGYLHLYSSKNSSYDINNITVDKIYYHKSNESDEQAGRFILKNSTIGSAVFKDCTFINKFTFINNSVDEMNAQNSTFNDFCDFSFNKFIKPPEFYGAKLFQATTFKDCSFASFDESAVHAYRDLKYKMMESKNHTDEILFTSFELESMWRAQTWWNFGKKITGWIYYESNRFGREIKGPILWLIVWAVLMYLLVYSSSNAVVVEPSKLGSNVLFEQIKDFTTIERGIWYSLINSTGIFKLHPASSLFSAGTLRVQTLAFIHTLVAAYCWFLIFAWIRRQYKPD